ncbi:unnamed protein product [Parnassius apollo]|uniref:(apollo) hypothetical protein n=1 Tax=Parnassius apollo TaxID=110799 RepID=A0A8S3WS11_PARAO|nr:unnamed protein product [Parnassius apollo]
MTSDCKRNCKIFGQSFPTCTLNDELVNHIITTDCLGQNLHVEYEVVQHALVQLIGSTALLPFSEIRGA